MDYINVKGNNFKEKLPSPQSDLAHYTLKDPYIFDFLSIGKDAHGAPRSAWRTVGENPTQTKSSQQFGTDHYVA
ncbi:hypothetical protein [Wolbachia endosymbiont (group A) of Nomada goodeniana]|uniref:hypothetical protein n=1 Tax=Wolbachia endosymbiont (group A) of Nomada goodeniana TaxID=3066207 RepID=UPI00333FA8B5